MMSPAFPQTFSPKNPAETFNKKNEDSILINCFDQGSLNGIHLGRIKHYTSLVILGDFPKISMHCLGPGVFHHDPLSTSKFISSKNFRFQSRRCKWETRIQFPFSDLHLEMDGSVDILRFHHHLPGAQRSPWRSQKRNGE